MGTDKNAIGFNSSWYAHQKNVKSLSYNGIGCEAANVKSGQYPGVRVFSEVSKGPATGAALKFIKWIVHSKAAAKIIASQWVSYP